MRTDTRRSEIFQSLHHMDRSGRPKYQRLADVMVEAFRKGVWRPGDQLPAEEELTALTPYSLGTVQRTLRDLTDQGLIVRQHGLGSFVADRPRELHDPWHCRFLADDQESILPIYSQAVARKAVTDQGVWSKYLEPNAMVMRLDRIITVNDEFKIYTRFYADRNLLKRLWEMPVEKMHGANFKQLIVRQCQLPITDITHLVSIDSFDDEACAKVDAPSGYQGLYLQAIAKAGRDRTVYYQEFFVGKTKRLLKFPETTVTLF